MSTAKTTTVVAVTITVALALATATVATAAGKGKGKGTRLAPAGERVEARFPEGWKDQPEIGNMVAKAMLGTSSEIVGGARAFGDLRAGRFGVLMWVATKQKVSKVRPELQAFIDSMKGTVVGAGMVIERWEQAESATRLWVDYAGVQQPARVLGRAVGVVDQEGLLHGYALQCVWTGKDEKDANGKVLPVKPCVELMDSLNVTWKDSELRPLERAK